ncbi:hypothetical protein DXG01_012067 [Tephrocybe rancida]|nr:hypothetical protein DXG01_012067 [Tephrocybe rancida]
MHGNQPPQSTFHITLTTYERNADQMLSKKVTISTPMGPYDKSSVTPWFLPQTDPFTIIETSLTSVKYAIYHTIGHYARHTIGSHNATATTYLRTIGGGFIGGAIFTIPYLFLLRRNSSNSSRNEDESDLDVQWLPCLCAEMLYSGIAGGVGALALGGGAHTVLIGVVNGLGGPLMLYVMLYGSLRIVLAAIWIAIQIMY